MKKITFITCWWTIDKDYSVGKWSYYFTFWEPAIYKILKLINLWFQVEVFDIMQKDSFDMNNIDRINIKDTIQWINNDKIIITHWTDTMIDTWKLLNKYFMDKVIILVWSSIPENFKNTDAHINLWFAMWICNVLSEQKKYWIYICMNWQYFDIDNVKKNEDWTFSKIK